MFGHPRGDALLLLGWGDRDGVFTTVHEAGPRPWVCPSYSAAHGAGQSCPAARLRAASAQRVVLDGLRRRIRLGDVITTIDGEAIRTYDDLARLLDRHNVGDRIKLGIRRSGKEQTLSLQLQAVQ